MAYGIRHAAQAISIGMVTCFSTFFRGMAWKERNHETWTSVTSGKASMGRVLKATIPLAIKQGDQQQQKQGLVQRQGDHPLDHTRLFSFTD